MDHWRRWDTICQRLRTRSRRLRSDEAGVTLTELLTVLVMMGFVMAGLTTVIVSAINTESRQRQRLEAQQQARLALDRIRRDVHCARSVTASTGAVSEVTAVMPAVCFGSSGADVPVVYRTVTAGPSRWRLERVQGATTITVADFLTSGTPFTYTVPGTGTLGSLAVNLPVDVEPADGPGVWRLTGDVVLRNTDRL